VNWLDRVTLAIAPLWTMRRVKARVALDLFERNYEAASIGRRTQGWRVSSSDANSALFGGLARLRENARDLVRNNPYAESAVSTVADHTVGWGIVAKPAKSAPRVQAARFWEAWKAWAESTACDAEGRLDFAGLEKLVTRSAATDGEVLVRRRWRRPEDNLPLPLQLQVIESDYLDTLKDGITTASGGSIIQGIEYDVLGKRSAYWLYRDHPGATWAGIRTGVRQSVRIPASEILHVYKVNRPGQARGPSWFAPVLVRLKDFDEYEDAALMKQKIAACLAVLTTDIDGTTPPIGESPQEQPKWDVLEPGMIANLAPGRAITVVDPPSVSEHAPYSQTVLRAIAAGFGTTYEDLTGDYANMPFSAARMSRLRHWARVEDWRWRMLIPQFCDPAWAWAVEAARVANVVNMPIEMSLPAEWTAPPMPMIEPDKEGLAYQRNIRTGIQTLSDAIRERGYDPVDLLAEYAKDNELLDKLGIILDSDARQTTQQGGPRTSASTPGGDSSGDSTSPNGGPPTPSAAKASTNGSRNGHFDPVERAFTILENAFAYKFAQPIHVTTGETNLNVERGAIQTRVTSPAAPVTVSSPVTIEEGALRVDLTTPPSQINVSTPEVRVEPSPVTFEEGAIKLDVAASPPAVVNVTTPDVRVEAPVTIAEGAIRVDVAPAPPAEVHVAPPDVRVDAPVTIAEGAIKVDVASPTLIENKIEPPALEPKINIVKSPRRRRPPSTERESE
jgi:lambda family phage portal protein